MIRAFIVRYFHLQEVILLLSLPALICLPISLSNLVRGAGLNLFLPITLIGILLTCLLVVLKARRISTAVVLLGFGPLALFIHVGGLGGQLIRSIGQTLYLISALYKRVWLNIPFNLSTFISARLELLQSAFAVGERTWLWLTGIWNGVRVEDPMARILIWSMGLWLTAAWAGWQIYRNRHLLAGMVPSTIMMAFVIDYTNKEKDLLWVHLGLLLFLFGLSSFEKLHEHWILSHVDYSDSTGLDTLVSVIALTIGLVTLSMFVSSISFKDILEDLREKRAVYDPARTESLGLEQTTQEYNISGTIVGLPRSHLIDSGPELSRELVMTISTGDLPPMPLSANPSAPRYYWRTITYQIYTGYGWRNPDITEEQIDANQPLFESSSSIHRLVHQQVTLPEKKAGRLYWAGTLLRADTPFSAAWLRKVNPESGRDALLDSNMLAALTPADSYRAESLVVQVSAMELRASPAVYPNWVRNQFLGLPERVPDRVLTLARDLTASKRTPYDRAIAIQNYLREFPYTLEVEEPQADREVADYFLFDLKEGYCDYYATTMVVLARAAGLPARLVVGYATGSYDPESAQYVVTENYAHSWVEIYFSNFGWVEFEPTAGQPAIQFAEESQAEPYTGGSESTGPLKDRFTFIFQWVNLWLPAVLLIGFIPLWAVGDSIYLMQLAPSRSIQLVYKRLRRLARPLGGIPTMDQTAHQYASLLTARLLELGARPRLQVFISPSQGEIRHLTNLYTGSLFAPKSPSRREARVVVRTWLRLRWRIILANLVARFH